ncbi:MAG: hypothetical protein V7637_4086 [Mycobacteriales bacterium]|jgi:hypothetical protein
MYDPATSPLTPAATFAGAPPEPATADRRRLPSPFRPREIVASLVDYYRDPLSWLVVGVTSFIMCYVGGAAMFWYHAIHLGEGGPAISWEAHWFLDSTVGFVALTPAVIVILPLASWVAQSLASDDRRMRWLYAGISGVAFGLITIPGPLMHNFLVGRGTWVANQVTHLIGNSDAVPKSSIHYSGPELMAQQFRGGLPVYVLLSVLSLWLVRGIVAAAYRRNSMVDTMTAVAVAADS